MTSHHKSIIRTLLYFDIFGHPLDGSELYEMLATSPDPVIFRESLQELTTQGFIGHEGGYYFIPNGHSPVRNRIVKLERASKYMRIARFMSHLIYQHPFVRAVMVSGSLSKSAAASKDDIDFFIVAEPGRVWICRAFLMMFKKLFLLNSKRYFCINYFVDSGSMTIPDRNIFTATEVAFLIPLQNSRLTARFLESNRWVRDFFPNKVFGTSGCSNRSDSFIKTFLEWTMRGRIGEKTDSLFLKLYRRRAEQRYSSVDRNAFMLNIRNEKNVAKYHPQGFQHQILERYSEKLEAYEARFGIGLTIQHPADHG